jgi:hypothetical protein
MRTSKTLKAPSRTKDILLWAGLFAVIVAFGGYAFFSNAFYHDHAFRADNGCLAFVAAPATLVVIDDATDKLADDQPRRWQASVNEEVGALPTGARVVFADIGPVAPTEVKFDPALCVPPVGNGKRQNALQDQFQGALDGVEKKLEAASATPRSAIRGTIVAAALDPAILPLAHKDFLIASDFLENDPPRASVYGHKRFVLPPVVGTPFKGARMRFVVLRNERDARLQTPALVQAWMEWARAGGATVEVDAPWLGFTLTPRIAANEGTPQ